MKIEKVINLTCPSKITRHRLYAKAKKGCFQSAYKLIDSLNLNYSRFELFDGFICPVQKIKGNQIPVALACKIMEHSQGKVFPEIYVTNKRPGNQMALRILYDPEFYGKPLPGNYIIVDDMFTTGNTLKHLKNHIESFQGSSVIKAVVLASNNTGSRFEPSKLTLRLLKAKFPDIDRYFDLEALTHKQANYLLKFNTLQSFYMKFFDKNLYLQNTSFS